MAGSTDKSAASSDRNRGQRVQITWGQRVQIAWGQREHGFMGSKSTNSKVNKVQGNIYTDKSAASSDKNKRHRVQIA